MRESQDCWDTRWNKISNFTSLTEAERGWREVVVSPGCWSSCAGPWAEGSACSKAQGPHFGVSEWMHLSKAVT